MKRLLLALMLVVFSGVHAQWQSKYEAKLLVDGNDTLRYRIMYPKDFKESESYPVILFLHGAGERGNDNESQLVHGAKLFATDYLQDRYPAIVIFPQCPKNGFWSNLDVDSSTTPIKLTFNYTNGPTTPMALVMQLLDDTIKAPYSKDDQVYLMGLSMGGMGTFELLSRRPNTFAAAVPICGGGDTDSVGTYSNNTPLWVFHGAQDNVVNPLLSIEMVSALLKAGAHPQFTLYDFAGHNSWDPAFADPELLPWLFSHHKKSE